ncbi:unnamed protein product [Closterium sp. NIES-53]
MTTLRVLLHVAAQRDYELHSLDFSIAFLQGSLHEEIWLRRPPGFTGSFPPGTQWSLRRPVYGLHQAPREWHDTLRTTLAALGFAPSTADPSLFLRIDTSLPSFYVLVYVDDLVFATADTAGLAHVKSELQKRHTCTDLGELRSYLGLQITRDRAQLSPQLRIFVAAQPSSSSFGFSAFSSGVTQHGEQPRSPPVLYVDNKAMLALCREHSLEHRTKHIAFCYFLARELQQRGQLRLAYVASEANTADIFTKALAPGDHQRFCTMLACFALFDWSCDLLFSPTLPMGGPPDVQGSNANLPRAGPSRVRRQPTRTAASVRPVAEPDEDESNSEYRGDAVGSDDEDNEPEDLGMSDDEEGDDDDDDVAEEEVQSVRTPAKRNANRASGADKRKGKETAEEPRHEPRKKRATAPREKSMWSDRESTIFVAARWFTKDKFQLLKGKQGMQYWARLLAHVKESNSDWIQGINALQKQWRNLMLLWKEYKRGDTGSGNGSVEKPPWWPYMELYNKDTAAADPHAVDGGGATNVSVPAGMEVPTSSQPSTSTPTLTDPDGEDAGPFCDDGGDVNTVTPGDDDVEIWVRGADD